MAISHDWIQTLLLLGERLEKFKPAIAAVNQQMPGLFGLGLADKRIWLEIKRIAQSREGRNEDYRSFIDFLENGIPPVGNDWIAKTFQQMARNRLRLILAGLPVTKEKVAPAQGGGRVEVTSVDHRVEALLWIGKRAREDGYEETVRQMAAGNILKRDPMAARLLREWVDAFQNRGNPRLEWLRRNLPQINPNQWGDDLHAWADAVEARPNLLTRPWFLWTMGIMILVNIVIFTIIGFNM
jgi:hypothetical protein